MRDAGRQNPGLASAGARQNQQRAFGLLDSCTLFIIQPFEIRRRALRRCYGAGRNGQRLFRRAGRGVGQIEGWVFDTVARRGLLSHFATHRHEIQVAYRGWSYNPLSENARSTA